VSQQHSFFDSIFGYFVSVHRVGHKFIGIGLVSTLVLFWIWSPLGWLALFATLWVAYFFRDPDRVTPLRAGLVIAPADGVICRIERVRPPDELSLGEERRVCISICLSPFDVHVNRAPVAGRIVRSVYIPGVFLNPNLDKASEENERRALVIKPSEGGEIALVQIAGVVSRRIISFAQEGDTLGVGQRFGLIRFGSRVDIYLPPGKTALVAVDQRMIAGETVLADLVSDEPERESRRS